MTTLGKSSSAVLLLRHRPGCQRFAELVVVPAVTIGEDETTVARVADVEERGAEGHIANAHFYLYFSRRVPSPTLHRSPLALSFSSYCAKGLSFLGGRKHPHPRSRRNITERSPSTCHTVHGVHARTRLSLVSRLYTCLWDPESPTALVVLSQTSSFLFFCTRVQSKLAHVRVPVHLIATSITVSHMFT